MINVLNFLSFESCNFFNLTQHLTKTCGNFNPYCIRSNSPMGGYTISYAYNEVSKFFDETVYILIKEDPAVILQHLLYGYYKGLYDKDVVKDFKNFFNIDLTQNNFDISLEVNNYYEKVFRDLDGKKLITVDLTKYNNSFYSFLYSPEGLPRFVFTLNDVYSLISETKTIDYVLSDVMNYRDKADGYFYDYFINSKWHGVPNWYLPTHYCKEQDATDWTYLEWFLESLKHEI